jgi:hypothetical protein
MIDEKLWIGEKIAKAMNTISKLRLYGTEQS